MREYEFKRTTKETDINLYLNLDGNGHAEIKTGIGFFDHMLTSFACHSGFDIALDCKGDLQVDMHHTVEDVGIVLGNSFKNAIGDKTGIKRFASSFIPMDEALAFCSIDISGRPYVVYNAEMLKNQKMDGFNPDLCEEFMRAFAYSAGITLHTECKYGKNAHHIIEALFKSLAKALKEASTIDSDRLLSSKGVL